MTMHLPVSHANAREVEVTLWPAEYVFLHLALGTLLLELLRARVVAQGGSGRLQTDPNGHALLNFSLRIGDFDGSSCRA